MSIELKTKRLDDSHTVYYDADTSDPIATVRRTSIQGQANKKRYSAKWHPAFNLMYPNASDLVNVNFGDETSESDVKSLIAKKYTEVMRGDADPLKTKLVGTTTRQWTPIQGHSPEEYEFNHYHVLDDDENHVASMYVRKQLADRIGTSSTYFGNDSVQVEFHGNKPNHVQQESLRKKNPEQNPIAMLHRIKDWLESAGKEPSFVGSHEHSVGVGESKSRIKHYTTNLSPEDASKKFEEHLKSDSMYEKAAFVRHSPTMFSVNRPSTDPSVTFHKEYIDTSAPNTVVHSKIPMFDKANGKSNELNEVIA